MSPTPSFTGHPTGASHSAGHQQKAVDKSAERKACSHAGYPSKISIACARVALPSGHSTPWGLNIDKDLPTIPPPQTGLWGLGPVIGALPKDNPCLSKPEVSSCLILYMILFVSPLCKPQHLMEMNNKSSETVSYMTTSEAGLFGESWFDSATWSWVPEWMSQVSDDHSSKGSLLMDSSLEVSSSLPVTPTIHCFSIPDLEDLNMIAQDGPFLCPRMDCHDVLSTPKAFAYHIHIHLVHEV